MIVVEDQKEKTDNILEIEDLHVSYAARNKLFNSRNSATEAVKGVSFNVKRGETFAIVGESGSGKTSIAMSILGFVKPDKGTTLFNGIDLGALKGESLRNTRRLIQPVFQDANSALNPRMTAESCVMDGLSSSDRKDNKETILALLKAVGLEADHLNKYPHQLSGGQKQRLCIARALAPEPELLILDEPVSAQDLSIQAQIINLLLDLKEKKRITYLLISHDLRVVRSLADRMAIMKEGELLEEGECGDIFRSPNHPYTRELLVSSGLLGSE